MKIDKIVFELTNYGAGERVSVYIYRGMIERNYLPTNQSFMRLMRYTRFVKSITTFGSRHLRVAIGIAREEPYDPPFKGDDNE